MKGLLLKDMLTLKRQGRILILLMGLYVIMSIMMKDSSVYSGMVLMICSMMPFTAAGYDERAHWEKYGLSLPVTRKQMVLSKYLLGLIFIGVGAVIVLIFNLVMGTVTIKESLVVTAALCGCGLVVLSFTMPVIFKFGVEKGRFVIIALVFVPVAGSMVLSNLKLRVPDTETLLHLAWAAPVIVLLILLISIVLSIDIFEKKEF